MKRPKVEIFSLTTKLYPKKKKKQQQQQQRLWGMIQFVLHIILAGLTRLFSLIDCRIIFGQFCEWLNMVSRQKIRSVAQRDWILPVNQMGFQDLISQKRAFTMRLVAQRSFGLVCPLTTISRPNIQSVRKENPI